MKRLAPSLLISLVLATGNTFAEQSSAGKPSGMPAEVIRLETRTLTLSLSAVGVLEANESVMLSPEQSGRINKILFQEGESVEAGTPLFQLDSAIYDAVLQQATARVRLSQLEFERADSLLQKRVGSQTDRDTKLAQLQVDQAELALARTRLSKMTVVAPFTGTLGLRQVSPGDFVNVGDPLVELSDTRSLKVQFSVPERHLGELHSGQTINLSIDSLNARSLQGEIYAISPSSDPHSHNISVRARVPNPDGKLKPGLFVRIEIQTGHDDQALIVPEEALILTGSSTLVMQMNEQQQVELVPVTTGERRYGEVQILSGLEPGAVIVTAGHLKLHPGMPITPLFPQSEAGKDA